MLKRIKEAFNRFIEKLSVENKKSFGSGKLDCCDLGKKTIK